METLSNDSIKYCQIINEEDIRSTSEETDIFCSHVQLLFLAILDGALNAITPN